MNDLTTTQSETIHENEMYISGALRTAVLAGATVVYYLKQDGKWHVLVQNSKEEMVSSGGNKYTHFVQDEYEVFHFLRYTSGSINTVKDFFRRVVKQSSAMGQSMGVDPIKIMALRGSHVQSRSEGEDNLK